jgi:hypothetical protein
MIKSIICNIYKNKKDWCTHWPEGTYVFGLFKIKYNSWSSCCMRHDMGYDRLIYPDLSRAQIDWLLFKCVKSKGHPVIAALMYIGVRLFGYYHFKRAKS